MHKYASIALIALAMAGLSAGAMADTSDPVSNGSGAYVGLKAGQSHWNLNGHSSSNEFGWGAQGGYRWGITPNQSAGVELGYVDFGHVRYRDALSTQAFSGKAVTLGGTYRYAFSGTPVYLEGRAGYERWYGKASDTVYNVGSVRDSDNGNGWYAGAGVGYDFSKSVSAKLSYDLHRQNNVYGNNHVTNGIASVGVEYRF